MSENVLNNVFQVLSIRIRTEMKYAIDRLDQASTIDAKKEASDALNAAIWNWEAYNAIWELIQGDGEGSELCKPDRGSCSHLRIVEKITH
tara:strand:- start:465 stop:734 length:270 start_codon:yes stop_codon:yes gene_type:complete